MVSRLYPGAAYPEAGPDKCGVRRSVVGGDLAELHMASRERMGREASPSAAVLDGQSVKSAEKGAAETAKWATTPATR
jgi:hypothetical protein